MAKFSSIVFRKSGGQPIGPILLLKMLVQEKIVFSHKKEERRRKKKEERRRKKKEEEERRKNPWVTPDSVLTSAYNLKKVSSRGNGEGEMGDGSHLLCGDMWLT